MIHKGRVVVHRKIDDLAKQIDREIEITVWGGASRIELALKDAGLTVRRMGRVMRILRQDESTVDHILDAAAKSQVQVRQMQEYEPSLEDLFLLIMDQLGYGTRTAADLLSSTPEGRVIGAEAAEEGSA